MTPDVEEDYFLFCDHDRHGEPVITGSRLTVHGSRSLFPSFPVQQRIDNDPGEGPEQHREDAPVGHGLPELVQSEQAGEDDAMKGKYVEGKGAAPISPDPHADPGNNGNNSQGHIVPDKPGEHRVIRDRHAEEDGSPFPDREQPDQDREDRRNLIPFPLGY
jgi:hypothetical protein